MAESAIVPTIPLDQDGKHHGFLRLPYSRDDSAWGSVMIPITVIKNGDGPTALVTGANHGDEYEGPVAIQNLAHVLEPSGVAGRIILVPFMNFPAFQAGKRTSPIDDGNMNRIFPGNPRGTVTEKIADYFESVIVPQSDFVLDFHSGGKTLDFVPFAAAHELDDKKQEEACVAAMLAFNAPYSLKLLEIDNVGMYDTAVEGKGKVFVSTELRGGGGISANSAGVAKKGLRNFLIHAGVIDGVPESAPTMKLQMPDADCFVFSESEGLLEPLVDLGEKVTKGKAVCRIWSAQESGAPPIEYKAKRSGLLIGRHFPGLAKMGDCLSVVGVPA